MWTMSPHSATEGPQAYCGRYASRAFFSVVTSTRKPGNLPMMSATETVTRLICALIDVLRFLATAYNRPSKPSTRLRVIRVGLHEELNTVAVRIVFRKRRKRSLGFGEQAVDELVVCSVFGHVNSTPCEVGLYLAPRRETLSHSIRGRVESEVFQKVNRWLDHLLTRIASPPTSMALRDGAALLLQPL